MAIRKPVVQQLTIGVGDLTKIFDIRQGMDDGRGNTTPENVWLVYTPNAMDGAEVMNVYGRPIGMSTYLTAVITTEIDLAANDEDTVRLDLSAASKICSHIKFVAGTLDGSEEVALTLYTW
jgi:hypothetical protein